MRWRLAFQLIVSLLMVFASVNAVSRYLDVGPQERQLLEIVVLRTDQMLRSITAATWQAMLADQREGACEVMRTTATRQGVDNLRRWAG